METKATFSDAETERERRNRALARDVAAEGIVLLENDGVLPLEPGRLALLGAGAGCTVTGGTGSGEVNVRHAVSVLEGLESAGFEVTTKGWIERYDRQWEQGREEFVEEQRKAFFPPSAKAIAHLMAAEYRYPDDPIDGQDVSESGTDTCVYVISRQSGEGHDRRDEAGDFRLSEVEVANIRRCAEGYERFVLVLNVGGPMDLSPLDEIDGIDALVLMGQLGMEGGAALAEVLGGTRAPSGKLALTWASCYADYPGAEDFGPYAGDPDHARYEEGIYVGYRYFDSFDIEPRYPFGYGLGYTEFSLSTTEVGLDGATVRLGVDVVNVGSRHDGKEVVQVYASCPQAGQPKEYQRLVAFAKTGTLGPGEREHLDLAFELSALASYDEERAVTYLEAGEYVLRVGNSSRDTAPVARLRLSRRMVLARHRNLCAALAPVQRLQAPERDEEHLPAGLTVLGVDPESLPTVTYSYELPDQHLTPAVEAYLESFSERDMTSFCAGSGLFGEDKGFCTPGAVGHTTADYLDRGIPNRELCDGPAGLRVQRRSVLERNGKIKALDLPLSIYEYLPRAITRFMLGDPGKGRVVYQSVTGFPVASAIAQTWNAPLAERVGRAIGTEMAEYGVTWWLAPALNIVRNPLCGRTFEYFSEDPLVSGAFAASLTRGVQSIPGRFATIKHFAANSQEDHRHHVSSDVDERVLREIYLRGFEIAVREGAPRALMCAYNRINGVYCANDGELCNDILRCEWGFDGVVMTDWLSTGKDRARDAECPDAGVDLIMPGGKGVVRNLLKGLRNGGLSPEALRRSCARVLGEILA